MKRDFPSLTRQQLETVTGVSYEKLQQIVQTSKSEISAFIEECKKKYEHHNYRSINLKTDF